MGEEKKRELTPWSATADKEIKRRENGELYARFTSYGVRIEQRLHETTMAPAKKAVERIKDILRAGGTIHDVRRIFSAGKLKPDEKAVLLGEHWSVFFKFKSEGSPKDKVLAWRQKTRHEYASFWRRSYSPFWGDKLPNEINEQAWEAFIDFERARSARGEDLSFDNLTKYFRTFTNWLVKTDVLVKAPKIWNPDPQIDEDEEEDGHGVVFTDEQLGLMLGKAEGPFLTFVSCAMFMGMRSSEITQMKKNRLDLGAQLIRLRPADVKTGSKTKVGRKIPIHPRAKRVLEAQIERSGDSPYLFPNARDVERPMDKTGFFKSWNSMKYSVGIVDGTPHHLRHTYATKVFSNPNINPVLACKSLGMSMQTAMKHYIHFDETHLHMLTSNFKVGV